LWVGGTAASLDQPRSDAIRHVRLLPEISSAVATWRDQYARAQSTNVATG
jgi:hypothetical protein